MFKKSKNKKSIFKKIADFFVGVKEEAKKVMWTSKKELLKYSIATLVFMIFICVFFVATDFIIALVKGLIG